MLTRRGEELVALIPAEDVQLLEAIENQIDLEDARVALKEAKKKGLFLLMPLKNNSAYNPKPCSMKSNSPQSLPDKQENSPYPTKKE